MQRGILLALLCAVLVSCGSAPVRKAQDAFDRGQFDEAIDLLSSDKIGQRNKLLALLEKGLIQHHTTDYAASSKTFLEAVAFLDATDYLSLSEQGTALAINDWATIYRGEYAERLWIHTYQMMNFLLLNQASSAAVEARQALAIYAEHGSVLQEDYFTRALIAASFEAVGLPNDAYIEYRKLAEMMPRPEVVAAQLAPLARQLGFQSDAKKYRLLARKHRNKTFSDGTNDTGELLLFVASGRIPKKLAGDIFVSIDTRISFPVYDFYVDTAPEIEVAAAGTAATPLGVSTNLGAVVKTSLSARGKKIAAKQLARVGVKHALVDLAEEESRAGAALLNALLFVLEEADTRSWKSLPGHLTLLRIPLPAGTHNLTLNTASSATTIQLDNVTIRPGQRAYRRVRL